MKKWILLAAVCSLPFGMMAQDDDMYFVPTKENVAKESKNYGMPSNTYYSGSNRSVDDYNGRLSSSVTPIDSAGKEVENDDYKYTRRLSRFDDYTPSQAYWEGYRDGRWSSPWYYSRYGLYSSWYDPWYNSWYDPWYVSWYDPWYDSWYYGGYYGWSSWRYGWYGSYYRPWGYYGYYTPIYYIGGHGHRTTAHDRFHANRNVSGNSSFGNSFGRSRGGNSRGGFGNARSNNNRTSTQTTSFGNTRNGNTGFGNRSNSGSSSFGTSRSSGGGGGSRGGGSFGGGARSGGGGGRFGR